eukprot:Gb_17700 [translate_table: standard]
MVAGAPHPFTLEIGNDNEYGRIDGCQLDGECKNKEEEEDLPKEELEDEKTNEEQTRGGLKKEHELGQSRVQGIARFFDANLPKVRGSRVKAIFLSPLRISKAEKISLARRNSVDDLMDTSFPCLADPRRCSDAEGDAQSDHSGPDKKTKNSYVEQPGSHESCRGVQSSTLNSRRANGKNHDRDGKQFSDTRTKDDKFHRNLDRSTTDGDHLALEYDNLHITLYLDHTYDIQMKNVRSLWNMGLQLFHKHLSLRTKVEHETVTGLLRLIEKKRMGESSDRTLLNHLLMIFFTLCIYAENFEKPFLEGMTEFYASKGVRYMQQLDVPNYLKHVEARQHKEHEHCMPYVDGSTRKSLVATAEKQLLDHHTHAIMEKGSIALMDENRNALELLQQALSTYIKTTGHGIVMDKVKGKDMISSLLDLKASLNTIWEEKFFNNEVSTCFLSSTLQCLLALYVFRERYVYPTICIHGDLSLKIEQLFVERCESMLSDQDTSKPPHAIFNVLYGERPNFSKVCGKEGNSLAVSRFVVLKKGRTPLTSLQKQHSPANQCVQYLTQQTDI